MIVRVNCLVCFFPRVRLVSMCQPEVVCPCPQVLAPKEVPRPGSGAAPMSLASLPLAWVRQAVAARPCHHHPRTPWYLAPEAASPSGALTVFQALLSTKFSKVDVCLHILKTIFKTHPSVKKTPKLFKFAASTYLMQFLSIR